MSSKIISSRKRKKSLMRRCVSSHLLWAVHGGRGFGAIAPPFPEGRKDGGPTKDSMKESIPNALIREVSVASPTSLCSPSVQGVYTRITILI